MTEGLPVLFRDAIERMPDVDSQLFFSSLDSEPSVSVRFNPFKRATAAAQMASVPWCEHGRYLDSRPVFTTDPVFHGGGYYVQEASSMFIEQFFKQHILTDVPRSGLRVLDLCAAPGGKSTHIASLVGTSGMVVANEVIRSRASVLAENVQKWGIGNTVVTSSDPQHFARLEGYFDVVAVDAPCSGEGMFRKTPEARSEWSADNVNLCSQRQRRIVSDVWDSLRPGGVMIYSTCTFNMAENEDNVRWIAETLGGEPLFVDIQGFEGVVQSDYGYRFYPYKVRGEGFFIAAIRKAGDEAAAVVKVKKPWLTPFDKRLITSLSRWIDEPQSMRFAVRGDNVYGFYESTDIEPILQAATVIYSGVMMGQMIRTDLKPEHSLAMFHAISPKAALQVEVPAEVALEYLRKNDVDPSMFAEGLNVVKYNNIPLGFIKRIGGRCNNMYPKNWRVLNK